MQVRIFQASGHNKIDALQQEINLWLREIGKSQHLTVKHVSTAMCQVADRADGERWQHLVVTVWMD